MTPLYYRPAHELVADLRSGTLSSVELTRAFLDRIKAINGEVNAVVAQAGEDALAQAKKADDRLKEGQTPGPLHGLPLTLKIPGRWRALSAQQGPRPCATTGRSAMLTW